ncbi:class I SAM-dependent methyltransferase [Amycolatopsis sp. NPDC058986]|uniref:class I SAM-dependent methyltransferase n=1 Tax=unclassified Amycolatopsis TaxID=2618356 RepID=UPI0036733B36
MIENDSPAGQVAARRPGYLADLAEGVDRFFEPRRASCPWCGSAALRTRLRTTDLLQHKPGRFVLDGCRDCGHTFQNPRLTPAGLEFYYRDCYDGLGEKSMSGMFEGNRAGYRSRAELVRGFGEPGEWLDVGMGHGHFCREAGDLLPGTKFDGLDLSDGVEVAQRKGWVRTAHRGSFVDLAGELGGRYDVVSMYHYLEHTPDPKRELTAARTALRPGGLLAIELPDPECRWAKVLGRWWLPWLQPQHLNLIPIGNLRTELAARGFTVIAEQRGEPHAAIDVLAASVMAVNALTIGGEDLAWRPAAPGRPRRILRKAAFVACVPVFVLAALLDRLSAPFGRKRGWSNAYRVVARRDDDTGG